MIRTRRPPRPLDPEAVKIANEAVWNAPEFQHLNRRLVTMEPKDLPARVAWVNAYLAALGRKKPTPAPVLVLEAIQPCGRAAEPAKPDNEPEPCSKQHPCRRQGLDLKANRDEYIEEMRALKAKLKNGTIGVSAAYVEMQHAVNMQLLNSGVPPVDFTESRELFGIGKIEEDARYDWGTHTITVKIDRIEALENLNPQTQENNFDGAFNTLAAVIYHEARHAEQTQRAADYAADMDGDLRPFAGPVRKAAKDNAHRRSALQYRCGGAIYDSIFGKGKEHLNRVYGPETQRVKNDAELAGREYDDAVRERNKASDRYNDALRGQEEAERGTPQVVPSGDGAGTILRDPAKAALEAEEAGQALDQANWREERTRQALRAAWKAQDDNLKDYQELMPESDAWCQERMVEQALRKQSPLEASDGGGR
jgi:hypothetical protein